MQLTERGENPHCFSATVMAFANSGSGRVWDWKDGRGISRETSCDREESDLRQIKLSSELKMKHLPSPV